jgi:flagellin
MSEVILSSAVRGNVASLRAAADLMEVVQRRLATGKKVNSPLDNPAVFFKAAEFSRRATDLDRVLENIGMASKTLEAADTSLNALTSLVESAQSLANSALASTRTTAGRLGTVSGLTMASAFNVDTGDTITINDGTTTVTVTAVANSISVQQIIDGVNNNASIKIVASLTSDGRILFESTQTNQITIGGSSGSSEKAQFGLSSGTTSGGSLNTTRSSSATQFDTLLGQINELVIDGDFNGVNLLQGGTLTVDFNESATSSLTVSGVTLDAAALGLTAAVDTWQTDKDIKDALAQMDGALAILRAQATVFSSNVSIIDMREEFTRSMIDTLTAASDELVVADINEESAALLALQTRQEISTTVLSLTAQAEASVLRLFI